MATAKIYADGLSRIIAVKAIGAQISKVLASALNHQFLASRTIGSLFRTLMRTFVTTELMVIIIFFADVLIHEGCISVLGKPHLFSLLL